MDWIWHWYWRLKRCFARRDPIGDRTRDPENRGSLRWLTKNPDVWTYVRR